MKAFSVRAFSLLEVVAVAALIAILASITLPGVSDMIVRNRITAEDAALKNLAASIKESFENTDLTANLAVFPTQAYLSPTPGGPLTTDARVVKVDPADPLNYTQVASLAQYPAGYQASHMVAFSDTSGLGTDLTRPYTASGNEWFVKLARLRGVDVTGTEYLVDRSTNPELAKVAFNASDRPRLLVICPPSNENDTSVRMMLLSLMASPEQLNLPAIPSDPASKKAWFDAIWGFNFDTYAQSLPALWEADTAWATEREKWRGDGSKSNLFRLRVERITLPIYSITLSNVHRSDTGTIYVNFSGSDISNGSVYTIGPGADTIEIRGLYAGRRVVVKRGAIGTENEVLRFTLRENSDVAIQ